MKIVILAGSPIKQGSSHILAENFAKGAGEAGHEIVTVSAAHSKISPCTGCVSCGYNGPCVQKDDMENIRQDILGADMLVFATPLYYYGMSAQLKILIDRFCAINGSIQRKKMKSALISAAWNSDDWTFDALTAHYHTLVKYLNFKDQGMILGKGCGTPSMTAGSKYPGMAYKLGKSLDS